MRSTARWLVPIAVVATIVGGTTASSAMAGDTPTLPERTPEQVLAAVAGSRVSTLSGSIRTHADLGLPALPTVTGSPHGSGDDQQSPQSLFTRFLAGDNTIRVWVDGPLRQRAQLIDPWAELNVVRNGSQLWTYDSRSNTALHGTVAAGTEDGAPHSSGPVPHPSTGTGTDPRTMTPDQLARHMLDTLDPTTKVDLAAPATVAGRDSYTLRITPRTTGTLVDRVLIAVDAGNGVPLQVTVFARGHAEAALQSGFTSVDFSRPAASRFEFAPPKSATVKPLPGADQLKHPDGSENGTKKSDAGRPTVIGEGWTTIVRTPAGATDGWASDPKTADMVRQLTTAVPGGRAVRTALFTVLFTDDGRVLAGAVPLQALQDAAARG